MNNDGTRGVAVLDGPDCAIDGCQREVGHIGDHHRWADALDTSPEGPEAVCRIDSDGKGLDDVAIGPVEMFRLERMGKNGWWCAVYMADGSRHVFWLNTKSQRITGSHHKEPPP